MTHTAERVPPPPPAVLVTSTWVPSVSENRRLVWYGKLLAGWQTNDLGSGRARERALLLPLIPPPQNPRVGHVSLRRRPLGFQSAPSPLGLAAPRAPRHTGSRCPLSALRLRRPAAVADARPGSSSPRRLQLRVGAGLVRVWGFGCRRRAPLPSPPQGTRRRARAGLTPFLPRRNRLEVVKEIWSTVSFQLHESVASEVALIVNMHTRKNSAARSAAGDHANTKTSRPSRRSTQPSVAEKKVTDLITSSSKKQKPVGVTSKKHSKGGRKLLAACHTADTENDAPQVAPSIPSDQQSDGGEDDRPNDSIFSPTYHHHKDSGLNNLSTAGSLEEQTAHIHGCNEATLQSGSNFAHITCDGASDHSCTLNLQSTGRSTLLEVDEYSELGNLSSEVSAIYLAMQQSKLECIDEHSQDSTSTEEVDAEETEEYDEFDPYSFIKDLPDLSVVVPKFRPVLLPKQTRSCPRTTLVLDLDETLVHSTLEHCEDADFTFPVHFNFREHTIYVRCRPYLKEFLERVASMFETIIFTASQSIYAEQLLNVLDPKRKLFRHRVYRESCVYVEGNYLKDLTVLGRDLTRVMIVDNSPQAFGFQLDNGIPIESWFEDPNDTELLKLLPFLESLVGVEDVRPYIARKFNLREKVATATSLTMDMQM